MPTGTAVEKCYEALLQKGYSKAKAARIAQSQTGEALATGRPPKHPVSMANESDDEQMIRPSSARVSVSPGMQVLQDLRQAREQREVGGQPGDQSGGQTEAPPRARRRLPVIDVNRMAEPDRRYPDDVFSHG